MCFQGPKIRKTDLEFPPKPKHRLQDALKTISMKPRLTSIWKSQAFNAEINKNMTWKQAPNIFQVYWTQKASIHRSPNPPESDQIM